MSPTAASTSSLISLCCNSINSAGLFSAAQRLHRGGQVPGIFLSPTPDTPWSTPERRPSKALPLSVSASPLPFIIVFAASPLLASASAPSRTICSPICLARQLKLGLSHYTRQDLEAARDAGTPLHIQVLGLATIASDVTPELARAAIASVQVLGAFQASPAVKAALADRTA